MNSPELSQQRSGNRQPAATKSEEETLSARGHWIVSTTLVTALAVGFWLFSNGFLLTRMVLPDHSTASVLPFPQPAPTNSDGSAAGKTCEWYPAKFERAIILVVDAMRADFATWSDEIGMVDSEDRQHGIRPKPYHNRMPVINSLSAKFPEQTMLYRFRADPPTTTLQRLKGLTTGQLPTFIDAGSNFAGSAINEDNWLQAMRWQSLYACNDTGSDKASVSGGYKRNLVFLGDDTWISLFPEELSDTHAIETNDTLWNEQSEVAHGKRRGWARVRPFPSLNVWDLDTVDDGVLSRLPLFLLPPEDSNESTSNPEISAERKLWRQLVKQQGMLAHPDFLPSSSPDNSMSTKNVGAEQLHGDWDVIIAHGLGVDHCGHRFGPDHPAISQKLGQMNQAIELIVQAINRSDKPTVLYVFGDHGMDSKGDHGGDSPREVDAALWTYSNVKWNTHEAGQRIDRVLEAAESILGNLSLTDVLDGDLRSSWWLNTHLSDDYRLKDGKQPVKPVKMRSVPQIDLVSTLTMSLGLHIPFNNLGAVIPEFFASDSSGPDSEWGLLRALRLNAAQVMRYLEKYMDSSKSHGFSNEAVQSWRDMYASAETGYRELVELVAHNHRAHEQSHVMLFEESVAAQYYAFLRVVLGTLRQMWAQFDSVLIIAGLCIIVEVLVALVLLYLVLRQDTLDHIVGISWKTGLGGAAAAAIAARSLAHVANSRALSHVTQLEATAFGAVAGLVGAFILVISLRLAQQCRDEQAGSSAKDSVDDQGSGRSVAYTLNAVALVMAAIHCLAFTSNSFTFNEDSIVLYLAQTLTLAVVLAAFKSTRSSSSDQQKAAGFRALVCSLIMLALNRITSYSTVCREEQLPGCTPTFYGAPSASISSTALASLNGCMVWLVPYIIQHFLRRSRSDQAMLPKLWVNVGMRICMGMAAVYWVLDSIDGTLASETAASQSTASSSKSDWSELRLVLARMSVGIAVGGGFAAWVASPFCIDVAVTAVPQANRAAKLPTIQATKQAAIILGFGNAYGAAYLMLVSVVFCVLYAFQQPMGGIMLSLLLVKLLLCVETFDSLRDALLDGSSNTSMVPAQMTLMALLAYLDYFATGHQFTLVSIQWSTAFVGVREMQLIVCGAIVVLNTFGSFILTSLCVPLAVLWNESLGSQRLRLAPNSYIARVTGAASIFAAYIVLVSVSTAVFAAWFRRHLMVWKIFAPRFMFSVPVVLLSGTVLFAAAIGFATIRVLRLGLSVGNAQAIVAQKIAQAR
ncbi:mannose-ethanolamine phosphotransferase gpi13 [Coemansia interrupta]|uniref:Mannose-ethanolamine phosphotransferase gpi13 n=1 Tax=Coemansia interrupta TaxID=1126814 RepID=A0A9W8HQ75_9FUNG|nr:mannose-ethanolamine phosphotransferase gpi13 [Coemansia interrupta]